MGYPICTQTMTQPYVYIYIYVYVYVYVYVVKLPQFSQGVSLRSNPDSAANS